jgi:general secretion pathway protein D
MRMTKPCAARATWLRKAGATASAAIVLFGSTAMGALAQTPPNAARFRGEPVTLNFVNADIEGVARAMSAILRQQFVVDPRVRGTITLYSEEPLAPRDAYFNFLAALRGLGFTVVEVNGLYKIVPEADAKLQAGTVSIGEGARRGDQVLTQIFRLNHENANNLVPVLRPLISPNNTINANPGNNTLVITDYADNLQRIGKIIAAMDVPASGDVEVISLRYAVAADIAPLIQRLTDGGQQIAGAAPGGAATLAAPSILVDSRSNSLIVRSPNPARMASIRQLIAKLDVQMQGSAAVGNIWVVHLRNADATKLATVIRAAFGGGAGGGGGGGGGGGASVTPSPLNAPSLNQTGSQNASSAATAPITPSGAPSTGGFIQADPATNSLIITAPEPLYRQVRSMIDQLDGRRAQVYIESMIVEVTGTNEAAFGFQWQGLIGGKNDTNTIIGGTNFSTTAGNVATNNIIPLAVGIAGGATTAAAAAATVSSGFNIGLVRNYGGVFGLSAIAQFLQSQANTNITSTPNLVTLDNEEAKIIVGSNVPFLTGQFTATGGSAISSPFQTIERKDVGITLRIKPQISEDGSIRMSIFQESSSIIAQATGTANAGPTTNKRSIESNVVVEDGQILVLGGLIEDRYIDDTSKVPLLGDIPYIGALFRSQSRSKTRTNLMVFLRPSVMRDADSTNRLSADRYDMIRSFQKDMQPSKNILLPVNETPVVPPLTRLENSNTPIAAPPTSPGTESRRRIQPATPAASDAPAPLPPPIIIPAPTAPMPITAPPAAAGPVPAAPASAPSN